jgi:hypothetical protein
MKHLRNEQLAEWLAGESDEETRVHLESCAQCSTEAEQVRDGISRYALAMRREVAQAQSTSLAGDIALRKALALHRLRWAGAGILTLLLAIPTAWLMKPRPAATTTPQPTASVPLNPKPAAQMSDDELLEAVNNDLSREVPQALAPVSAITTARNQIAAASIGAVVTGDASGK